MNAQQRKELRQIIAYQILNELLEDKQWDPVVTHNMSEVQCANRFYKAIDGYFDTHRFLCSYNKCAAIDLLEENKEIVPMMQNYNFHDYKEKNKNNL